MSGGDPLLSSLDAAQSSLAIALQRLRAAEAAVKPPAPVRLKALHSLGPYCLARRIPPPADPDADAFRDDLHLLREEVQDLYVRVASLAATRALPPQNA